MTFNKFKTDLLTFLDNSTVNLGRNGTKTRSIFIATIIEKLDAFNESKKSTVVKDKKENAISSHKNIMRIKPSDERRSLSIGKGVHSMTASESARADEQLGRSPYVAKQESGDNDDN